jgi:alpha-ketoglutarate-dependent taurine dioxygenase/4-hydroxybenzoate polyprenyltransferase
MAWCDCLTGKWLYVDEKEQGRRNGSFIGTQRGSTLLLFPDQGPMDYSIEKIAPFGAIVNNNGSEDSIEQFTARQIHSWIAEYRVVVFRGYKKLPKQDLALLAQKLGKPLQWPFGAINELKYQPDTENYIFTNREVPVHWDGAFTGSIPHVILFQCLIAPRKEDLGGTTFVNTEKILANASPSQRDEWNRISVTYKTEKLAHYGGEITQKFISEHEVEGQPVIRYAEPVADINPVDLTIHGLENKNSNDFQAEVKKLLYDPENLYTHRWEKGDFVLADNHTLLHGREAFKKQNERHIQRINILHRPQGSSIKRFIENSLTIRRKEFFVAELPIFIIPLLLSIANWNDFLQVPLYLGLAALFMLFNIGDMINCYADYKLDSIYKSHLSNAVFELGRENVKWQIIISGILAFAFTTLVAVWTHQYFLIGITIIGAFIGLQYSIKPFKFKSRGVWQFICLWGIIFFGPMLYTAIISNGFPNISAMLIFAFYGIHQMGIILLNTAEDYPEDINDGLNTIIVRLGFHRSLNIAFYLVLGSGIALQACLIYLFYDHQLPIIIYPTIGIFSIGWLKIVKEYKAIIYKINLLSEDDAIKEIKKNGMKVPEWLKLGAYSFLAVILAYFIWTVK